jgi:hypothetical protein
MTVNDVLMRIGITATAKMAGAIKVAAGGGEEKFVFTFDQLKEYTMAVRRAAHGELEDRGMLK